MIRANESATNFRNSLIEAQKATNSNIATLQETQQTANQRLQALETNMEFTVNGIRELLDHKKSEHVPDHLQRQDQSP